MLDAGHVCISAEFVIIIEALLVIAGLTGSLEAVAPLGEGRLVVRVGPHGDTVELALTILLFKNITYTLVEASIELVLGVLVSLDVADGVDVVVHVEANGLLLLLEERLGVVYDQVGIGEGVVESGLEVVIHIGPVEFLALLVELILVLPQVVGDQEGKNGDVQEVCVALVEHQENGKVEGESYTGIQFFTK